MQWFRKLLGFLSWSAREEVSSAPSAAPASAITAAKTHPRAPEPRRANRPLPELLRLLRQYQRSAWLPLTQPGEDGTTGAKFGGTPYTTAKNPWPACPNCGQRMALMLQLSADRLPAEVEPKLQGQLLQFFYCVQSEPFCEVENKGWEPFSKNSVVRLVRINKDEPARPVADVLPPQTITGWQRIQEYPGVGDLERLGFDPETEEEIGRRSDEFRPSSEDKVGGWPHWAQDEHHPACPRCAQPMEVLFQLRSKGHLPYAFGNEDVGHIYQCAAHPQVLAFGW